MKIFVLFLMAAGTVQAQASTLVPDYQIDCYETSMTANYKSVLREKQQNGLEVLQVREMYLNQILNQKSYSLTIGGMDQDGNRVLQAEEISFETGLTHERAILILSMRSGFKKGLMKIYSIEGDKVSGLKAQYSLICK